MPIVRGGTPATAHGDEARERLQPELRGPLGVRDDADRRAVVLAGGVARCHGRGRVRAAHDRLERRQALTGRIAARVLVAVDQAFAGAPVLDLHRHDLLGEAAVLVGLDRELVRAQRELVLRFPGDPVLAAQVLGGLEHAARHGVVDAAGGHAGAHEPILEHRAARSRAPAQRDRVELRLAHALGAAGEHQVGSACLHLHTRLDHRLQPRAAAAVDLKAGHIHRQAGVERRDSSERGRLGVGVALPEQHVVDRLGRQRGSLEHGADHRRGQPRRWHVAEDPPEAPHRRPQRLADQRVSHEAPTVTARCLGPARAGSLAGMPSWRNIAIARTLERVPGLKRVPAAMVIEAAEVVLLARQHVLKLEPGERRRVFELLRKTHGRPRNLTQRERDELAALATKAEPRLFVGLVVKKLSPMPLPKRLLFGSKRR